MRIQARAFQSLTKPELRFNNFGWNLGGPIFIPKLFNTEKASYSSSSAAISKRLRQGATQTWTVPNLAQRSGDFSALPTPTAHRPRAPARPFPGGVIPSNRLSPDAFRLIKNYPAPNFSGTGGNYVFNTVAPLDTNQYIYKVDYNMSSRNQISGHYVRDIYTSQQAQTQLIEYNRNIPGTNCQHPMDLRAERDHGQHSAVCLHRQCDHPEGGHCPNPLFISDYTRAGQGFAAPSIYNASNAIPTLQISGYQYPNGQSPEVE